MQGSKREDTASGAHHQWTNGPRHSVRTGDLVEETLRAILREAGISVNRFGIRRKDDTGVSPSLQGEDGRSS